VLGVRNRDPGVARVEPVATAHRVHIVAGHGDGGP
jgi:hypothetical protein